MIELNKELDHKYSQIELDDEEDIKQFELENRKLIFALDNAQQEINDSEQFHG